MQHMMSHPASGKMIILQLATLHSSHEHGMNSLRISLLQIR
jgi:hypothetical protein